MYDPKILVAYNNQVFFHHYMGCYSQASQLAGASASLSPHKLRLMIEQPVDCCQSPSRGTGNSVEVGGGGGGLKLVIKSPGIGFGTCCYYMNILNHDEEKVEPYWIWQIAYKDATSVWTGLDT